MNNKRFLFLLINIIVLFLFFIGCVSDSSTVESSPVESDFQVWADYNHDGVLEEKEKNDLIFAVQMLIGEPHDIETPLDEFFDKNRDGFIDQPELEMARDILFVQQIQLLFEFYPEIASQLDFNNNGHIDDNETVELMDLLIFDRALQEPHQNRMRIDDEIDKNNDQFIDEFEIEQFTRIILESISLLPFGPESTEYRSDGSITNLLEELADLNMNGFLEPEEIMQMEEALSRPHPVESEADKRLDFNNDNFVDEVEMMEAIRMSEMKVGPINSDEFQELPVITEVDRLFDINRNNIVEDFEMFQLFEIILSGPHDVDNDIMFDRFLDTNMDGYIDYDDLRLVKEMYFRPHPVDPDLEFDNETDTNRNGFIEPEEIGIAAGYSPDGPIPSFEERLEVIVWQREIEFGNENREDVEQQEGYREDETVEQLTTQRRIENIRDKSVAIVEMKIITENVETDIANVVLSFVENAFVNIGEATIVDRQSIDSILQEQEFQLSDLTDQSTVVQIGKSVGADYVVIGNISYIGEMYYLQVKLLSVETTEVIGSSIGNAKDATELLDMCNNAVLLLFK